MAKRLVHYAMGMICLVMLAACGSKRLDPLPADGVILAFGDSLTQGVGTSPGQAYPAVLESLSGRSVINRGISGEVTAEGRARFARVLDETRPNLVILCHGGNDILRRQPMNAARDNIQAMIDMARERNIDIVLVAVPEFNLLAKSPAFYQSLAEQNDIPLQGDIIGDMMTKPTLKSDQIHFNAKGYRLMAEAIHKLLVSEGALDD